MRRVRLCVVVTFLIAVAGASHAAWLVTTDGDRIETAGPWSIREDTVLFHTTRGVWSSISADAIDFRASRSVEPTKAVVPLEPLEPPPRKPVLVLTDRDLGSGAEDEEAKSSATESATESASVRRYSVEDLVVDRWTRERREEIGGFEIFGALRNATTRPIHDLGMRVMVYDGFGAQLATGEVFLHATKLAPSDHSEFRVALSDVHDFVVIRFQPFGASD